MHTLTMRFFLLCCLAPLLLSAQLKRADEQWMLVTPVAQTRMHIPPVMLGINLAPLPGHTLDLRGEYRSQYKAIGWQFGGGGMYGNRGRWNFPPVKDGTSGHRNSGVFVAGGVRYYQRRRWYAGFRMVGSWFSQQASYQVGAAAPVPLHAEGFAVAGGPEIGGNSYPVSTGFALEYGLQWTPVWVADPQTSDSHGVISGVGALGAVQASLTLKFRTGYVIRERARRRAIRRGDRA